MPRHRSDSSRAVTSRKNPAYRRMFRNAFRSYMLFHIALWIYCLVTTWINYALWIQDIDCPFPNYHVKLSNINFYTQSSIYLSYLTIPILWSAFMPFILYLTWMNFRWIDLPVKRRSSECWAWFVSLAKARHFEMSAVTLLLMLCEIALVFAGLFSNQMIHFPPLGRGVYATLNDTATDGLVDLVGVYATYRIGPRLDEVTATAEFAGNSALQLPQGPWVLSGYWRMTPTCRASIEAAIPGFSKGVRWSSMAAVTLIVGVTVAFDVARYIASRAAGTVGELDDEVKNFCSGLCAEEKDESLDDEDDQGCMRELCGVENDDEWPCKKCCEDDNDDDDEDDSQSGSDDGSHSGSETGSEDEKEEADGDDKKSVDGDEEKGRPAETGRDKEEKETRSSSRRSMHSGSRRSVHK